MFNDRSVINTISSPCLFKNCYKMLHKELSLGLLTKRQS